MMNRPPERLMLRVVYAALILIGVAVSSRGAPTIEKISLRGLQTGATTTLVIEGSELTPDPQIVLPVPIVRQELKQPADENRVEIDVTLDAAVTPGVYFLRVATNRGISNPLLVAVDHLAQRPFAAEAGALPVALHGALSGGTILRTDFQGRAGEQIVIDVESRRLGSNLNPVLHLFDARNAQVAWAQRMPSIAGDARIKATLPADGRYTVELHDALYRGDSPGLFRLKIGDLQYADLVYPLGAQRGTKDSFELVASNAPAGEKIAVDLTDAVTSLPLRWPSDRLFTGNRPQIVVGDFPEVVEQLGSPSPEPIVIPVAINGRLLAPHEEDRYVLGVTPGQKLRFTLVAAQAGSPLDGVLSVQKESGEQMATADDGPATTDPRLDFKVPAGVEKVAVVIKDLLLRGGPDFVYRLEVSRTDQPNFDLELLSDRGQVPAGGAELARVRVKRSGYNGPIKLSVLGLPPGITIGEDEIPAGASEVFLSMTTDGLPAYSIAHIIGKSVDPDVSLVRMAQAAETPATTAQSWLRSELAVAVTSKSPLSIVWETESADMHLPLGGRLPVHIKVTRAPFAAGAVRLELLTTQATPKKNVTNKNKRKERVNDVERTLRFDGMPRIAADQTETTATILVPADLENIPYDVAIRASLTDGGGKKVVAQAVTPARRLTSIQPLRIELAGTPRVEAAAGSGETGRITGKIHRTGDFPHPVEVTLTGLPADFQAPVVEVPADGSDFTLPVSFPYNTAPGELEKVAVVATADPDGSATVRSNEVPVAVQIVPGGPPPALYRLFEDEEHFVKLLTEGEGKAALESTDRYSGSGALRVTPGEKFRAKLPGLGVKIAETPADGEYRYLRFAWKKFGGGNIMLQLNADGKWGPPRGQGAPAYRYEAGPASNPAQLAALNTSDRLPYAWTVVTRDLFADFGAFELDGIAFTPGDGEAALFDQVYLARSLDDFKDCPAPLPAEAPLLVFEDQPEFVASMSQGSGVATLLNDDKLTGASSVKITPEQRYNASLPGLDVKIRQNPGPGEFRYLQFAWKKQGGDRICLQLNHDGKWGPESSKEAIKYRYDAGDAPDEAFGGALRLNGKLPSEWVMVTRDLYGDFGEFTLSGLALCPVDGEFALFDHIYLGRAPRDFDLAPP